MGRVHSRVPQSGACHRGFWTECPPRGETQSEPRTAAGRGLCAPAVQGARGAWGREGHEAAGVAPRRRLERVRGSAAFAACAVSCEPGPIWGLSVDGLCRPSREEGEGETREKAASLLRPAWSLRLRSSGKEAGRISRVEAGGSGEQGTSGALPFAESAAEGLHAVGL